MIVSESDGRVESVAEGESWPELARELTARSSNLKVAHLISSAQFRSPLIDLPPSDAHKPADFV